MLVRYFGAANAVVVIICLILIAIWQPRRWIEEGGRKETGEEREWRTAHGRIADSDRAMESDRLLTTRRIVVWW